MAELTTVLMDEAYINRVLRRISHQIIEETQDSTKILIVGINERGYVLAQKIAAHLYDIHSIKHEVARLICDDEHNHLSSTELNYDNDYDIVLVDDVIFSGYTMFEGLRQIYAYKKPQKLLTAALIDRGHRSCPIHCNFYGLYSPTKLNEHVVVEFPVLDTSLENASVKLIKND